MRFFPSIILLLALFALGSFVAAIIAFWIARRLTLRLQDLVRLIRALEVRISRIEADLIRESMDLEQLLEEEPQEEPPETRIPEPAAPPPRRAVEPPRPAPRPRPVEHKPPSPPRPAEDQQWWKWIEENVGTRWMTWAGAFALFLSVAFFLKYAFDNEWLGPTGRVVLGIAAGILIAVAGDYCTRRGMRILGQGLIGGSLAILYVSLFAAFSLYKMIPQSAALVSMVAVTGAGMTLAVLHNAVPLSFIAVLGGIVTPLMLATGKDPRDALFCYVMVLDLGVLGVACFKRWRALDFLAFAGTWALFSGWFFTFYTTKALIPVCLWLAVFFLIFLFIPFVYQLRTEAVSSVESFILALANAVITFAFAYQVLHVHYRFTLGFVAIAMAGCYLVLASLLRRRVPEDARSLFGFVGLSVVFVTLAVPLHLKLHGVTLAWAVEGPVLVYLGYLYRYRPVRIAGFLVLALAAGRLFVSHWPLHRDLYALLLNRHLAAAMFVPLAGWGYAAIHYWKKDEATDWDRYLMISAALAAGAICLVILSGEFGQWFHFKVTDHKINPRYLSSTTSTVIWGLGAGAFLAAALWFDSRTTFYAGLAVLLVAIAVSVGAYSERVYARYWLFLNARFVASLVVAFTAIAFACVASGYRDLFVKADRIVAGSVFAVACLFPLFLLSAEALTYSQEAIASVRRARWVGQMSLSVIWAVYAVVALILGFLFRVRALRIGALALLSLTAIKVLLLDMARVQQVYRIISFVVLGLTMIGASFLYHRLERFLGESTGEDR